MKAAIAMLWLLVLLPVIFLADAATQFNFQLLTRHQKWIDSNKAKQEQEAQYADPPIDMSTDHYLVFGVPRSASQATIKASYYKLSKLYHPDKVIDSARFGTEARILFDQVNTAYQMLGEKSMRTRYNWALFFKDPDHEPVKVSAEFKQFLEQRNIKQIIIFQQPKLSEQSVVTESPAIETDLLERKNKSLKPFALLTRRVRGSKKKFEVSDAEYGLD